MTSEAGVPKVEEVVVKKEIVKSGESEEPIATPARRRSRHESPAPAASGLYKTAAAPSPRSQKKAPVGTTSVPVPAPKRRCCGSLFKSLFFLGALVALIALAAFLLLERHDALEQDWLNLGGTKQQHDDGSEVPVVVTAGPALPDPVPSLLQRVQRALACPNARMDILDIMAGAPFEFGNLQTDDKDFYRLPRIASLAGLTPEVAGPPSKAEDELVKAVLELTVTGLFRGLFNSTRNAALTQRLRAALEAPCEAPEDCTGMEVPMALSVDEKFTSPGATSSGWLHQALLQLGAATGIAKYKERASLYKSRPATVVLSPEPAMGQQRDCLALRGELSTVSLRLATPTVIRTIVLEQPPRLQHAKPRSLPRRFAVYGDIDGEASGSNTGIGPYHKLLGTFEYAMAAPAAQAFSFKEPQTVRGLSLLFEGLGWGESFICLYRIKAYEAAPPVCSGNRLAGELPQ